MPLNDRLGCAVVHGGDKHLRRHSLLTLGFSEDLNSDACILSKKLAKLAWRLHCHRGRCARLADLAQLRVEAAPAAMSCRPSWPQMLEQSSKGVAGHIDRAGDSRVRWGLSELEKGSPRFGRFRPRARLQPIWPSLSSNRFSSSSQATVTWSQAKRWASELSPRNIASTN